MTPKRLTFRTRALISTAVLLLAAASTAGVAAASGAFRDSSAAPTGKCSAPALAGTVIDVRLMNMMNGRAGDSGVSMAGGTMRLNISSSWATAGTVSFRVANVGTLVHELVVLPLRAGEAAGNRAGAADGKVDERSSVGEASASCARGPGTGLDPGSIGWTTLQLPPGDYELICNLPGHYADGMYAELSVS